MRSRLGVLIGGEMTRLNKYNLFVANFVVLLLWIGICAFIEGDLLRTFIPVIFLMDTTMMTVLMTGATLFYEKKEHTVHSILVTPVRIDEYLAAKLVSGVINSLITVVFISAALYFVKGVTYNYALVAGGVIVTAAVHTLIGLWMSYRSANFTNMLVNFMLYVFVCFLPTLLVDFGVLSERVGDWMILLPPEAAGVLIGAGVASQDGWKMAVGYGWLAMLGVALYVGVVRPRFADNAMRELGV